MKRTSHHSIPTKQLPKIPSVTKKNLGDEKTINGATQPKTTGMAHKSNTKSNPS